MLLTHIFLYLVHFLVAPPALWKFNDKSLSYVHKINYSEDETELVQPESIFNLSPGFAFFHHLTFELAMPKVVLLVCNCLKYTSCYVGNAFTVLQSQYTTHLHYQTARTAPTNTI